MVCYGYSPCRGDNTTGDRDSCQDYGGSAVPVGLGIGYGGSERGAGWRLRGYCRTRPRSERRVLNAAIGHRRHASRPEPDPGALWCCPGALSCWSAPPLFFARRPCVVCRPVHRRRTPGYAQDTLHMAYGFPRPLQHTNEERNEGQICIANTLREREQEEQEKRGTCMRGDAKREVPLFDASGTLCRPWRPASSCRRQEALLQDIQAAGHLRHHQRRREARCEAQWVCT